jgi:hypothetical protein
MEDRSMLAHLEQPAFVVHPPSAKARPSDRTRRVVESFANAGGAVSTPLRALEGGALDTRFRSWTGASGRRYVFSVFSQNSCPTFEHAVALIATLGRDGERRAIAVEDTGCFPDISLAKGVATIPTGDAFEVHIHLLATSRMERAALVADLAQARRS